jgi:hypothetical protein
VPQEARFRRSVQEPRGGFAAAFAQGRLTKRSRELRHETVSKGVLRCSLGRMPSMRKAYQSDLSDAEWGCLESHLLAPETNGRARNGLDVRNSMGLDLHRLPDSMHAGRSASTILFC